MGYSTAEISGVRALPSAVSADDRGAGSAEPGFIEVRFESSAVGKHHQAYVDGRLAAVSVTTADRVLTAAAGATAASVVEVVAVDPEDRWTDFGVALSGFGGSDGSRVRVTWYGGRYLGDDLDHFEVYGGPAGSVDYEHALNAEPIAATVGGEWLGGFGRGGYGRGGHGRSATALSLVTEKLAPGEYDFEVLAVDGSGNVTDGPPATVRATVRGYARPPATVAVTGYDAATQTAEVSWSASEDV